MTWCFVFTAKIKTALFNLKTVVIAVYRIVAFNLKFISILEINYFENCKFRLENLKHLYILY